MASSDSGRAFYQRLARDTGFRVGELEKSHRLVAMLARLAQDEFLAGSLALKGGTALHLLHLGLARLSVDLDFNFIGSADREGMMAARPLVIDRVIKVARSLGYPENRTRNHYALWSLQCAYRSATGAAESLKVEVNFLDRVPALSPVEVSPRHPFPVDCGPVTALRLPELVAGKTNALIGRTAPKDVYDVAALTGLVGDRIVSPSRELTVLHSVYSGTDLRSNPLRIEVRPADLRTALLPCVRAGSRLEPAELIETANRFLDPLRDLRDREQEFIGRFFDGFEFKPSTLLEGMDYNRDVERHPAAEWILQGIRAKRERDGKAPDPS